MFHDCSYHMGSWLRNVQNTQKHHVPRSLQKEDPLLWPDKSLLQNRALLWLLKILYTRVEVKYFERKWLSLSKTKNSSTNINCPRYNHNKRHIQKSPRIKLRTASNELNLLRSGIHEFFTRSEIRDLRSFSQASAARRLP